MKREKEILSRGGYLSYERVQILLTLPKFAQDAAYGQARHGANTPLYNLSICFTAFSKRSSDSAAETMSTIAQFCQFVTRNFPLISRKNQLCDFWAEAFGNAALRADNEARPVLTWRLLKSCKPCAILRNPLNGTGQLFLAGCASKKDCSFPMR